MEKCQVLSTKVEGTVTFTKTLQAERTKRKLKGFSSFQELAKEFRGTIEERIEDDLGRSAGLKNRPRIYISGGAIWAIATLTNPEDVISQDLYVKFSLKKIREFRDRLRASGKVNRPDLTGGGFPSSSGRRRRRKFDRSSTLSRSRTSWPVRKSSSDSPRCWIGKVQVRRFSSPSPASWPGSWDTWNLSGNNAARSDQVPSPCEDSFMRSYSEISGRPGLRL